MFTLTLSHFHNPGRGAHHGLDRQHPCHLRRAQWVLDTYTVYSVQKRNLAAFKEYKAPKVNISKMCYFQTAVSGTATPAQY